MVFRPNNPPASHRLHRPTARHFQTLNPNGLKAQDKIAWGKASPAPPQKTYPKKCPKH